MKLLGALSRAVLAVPLEETSTARRGFHRGDGAVVEHLERIGREFLAGYHAALEGPPARELAARLNDAIDNMYRGFAFEGAGMAYTLTDGLHLTRHRFADLLDAADGHRYMVHVGAGWAWARIPWIRGRVERPLRRLDPLVGWLAVDGYGFHQGYFEPSRFVRDHVVPSGLHGYARRAFDQGVGRSLWFVDGADAELIARDIRMFAADRRADLWAGAGLACAYAGGVSETAVRRLRQLAAGHMNSVALGCAFACEARRRARNLVPHTDAAARALCGLDAEHAAAIAREESNGLTADGSTPAYEIWRQRTERRIASHLPVVGLPEVTCDMETHSDAVAGEADRRARAAAAAVSIRPTA